MSPSQQPSWIVDDRQTGKTTRILEWMQDAPDKRIYVCPAFTQAQMVARMAGEGPNSSRFWGFRDLGGLRGRGRDVEVAIDDADLILAEVLGYWPSLISATGSVELSLEVQQARERELREYIESESRRIRERELGRRR